MAWIRLSDDYNDHPKFRDLSDGSFRLWHQGMGFCRKYQTNGLIPSRTVREFKAYGPKRMRELMTPWKDGENPLWHDVPDFGVQVHDYLNWNPSKEEENERRSESKERMRQLREERRDAERRSPTRPKPASVSANITLTHSERSQNVPGWDGKKESLKKELSDDLAERAGRFREDTYPALYAKHRNGAQLPIFANSVEFQDAMVLVKQWDDARLEKLAVVVLTTDDPWISQTDRGFKIFIKKASWADDKLRAWELENGIAV